MYLVTQQMFLELLLDARDLAKCWMNQREKVSALGEFTGGNCYKKNKRKNKILIKICLKCFEGKD